MVNRLLRASVLLLGRPTLRFSVIPFYLHIHRRLIISRGDWSDIAIILHRLISDEFLNRTALCDWFCAKLIGYE